MVPNWKQLYPRSGFFYTRLVGIITLSLLSSEPIALGRRFYQCKANVKRNHESLRFTRNYFQILLSFLPYLQTEHPYELEKDREKGS